MPTGHYQRSFTPILDRLFRHVIVTPSCWLWQGTKSKFGHGFIGNGSHNPKISKKQLLAVHRVSYELLVGPIPNGLCVLHKCDVPSCLNPDHLFLGTMRENTADMISKNRMKVGVALPQSRLTEDEVRQIFFSTDRQKVLSEKFNVAQSTISFIKNGKHWKHITLPLIAPSRPR